MTVRGDAHPNSNSSWGHDVQIESGYEWLDTKWATEDAVDPDDYEDVDGGEMRYYIVGAKVGYWSSTGPGPSQGRACVLFVNEDATLGFDLIRPARKAGDTWHMVDGDRLPSAIARDPDESDPIPEEHAERYREVLKRAHGLEIDGEEFETEFSTASQMEGSQ